MSSFSIFQAMEELVRKGLCKAIGISNFSTTKVKNLLETAKIIPAVNQGTYCETVVNEPRNRHYVDCDKPNTSKGLK